MSARIKHLNGTVIRERSPSGPGPVLWSLTGPGDDRHYLWPGRGAGLYLVDIDGINPVTHQVASERYNELKQARGALARLLAEPAAYPSRPVRRPSREDRRPARTVRCTASRAVPNSDLLTSEASC